MEFLTNFLKNDSSSFKEILLYLLIGAAIGALVTVFNRRYIGRLVRRLLKKEAISPETALPLKKVGLYKNSLIRLSLSRSDSVLRKTVSCTLDKPKLKKEDFDTALFYIPKENSFKASEQYDRKNDTLLIAVIGIIGLAAVGLLASKYFPMLVERINNFF